MVAVDGFGNGKAVTGLTVKLKPRTASRREHEVWEEDLQELQSSAGIKKTGIWQVGTVS